MRTITPTRTRRPYEAAELVRYKRIETELNKERRGKDATNNTQRRTGSRSVSAAAR